MRAATTAATAAASDAACCAGRSIRAHPLARRDERRLDDARVERMAFAPEESQHPPHVFARLRIRRNAVVAVDGSFARVISRGRQGDLTAIVGKEPAQVRKAATDI